MGPGAMANATRSSGGAWLSPARARSAAISDRVARPPRQTPYVRRTTLQPRRRAPYPDAVQLRGHFRSPRELSVDPRRGPRPGAWPPSYSHPCRYRRGDRPRSPHSRCGPWRSRTSPRGERHHQATTAESDATRHRRKERRTRPIRLRTKACPGGPMTNGCSTESFVAEYQMVTRNWSRRSASRRTAVFSVIQRCVSPTGSACARMTGERAMPRRTNISPQPPPVHSKFSKAYSHPRNENLLPVVRTNNTILD